LAAGFGSGWRWYQTGFFQPQALWNQHHPSWAIHTGIKYSSTTLIPLGTSLLAGVLF
jgi:hypothetical protein